MAVLPNRENYCLCSEATLGELLDRRGAEPVPFDLFIARHTLCNEGCGTCIKKLRRLVMDVEVEARERP